ncbi:MAG: SusC/RagA family TonB-linked outer membrane protein, partial [Tannerellaceae bacterium]
SAMYENMPWDSPYDENGNLIQEVKPKNWVSSDHYNYQYDLQWNYEKKTAYEFLGNVDFDIKITDWLTFSSVNNYKYNSVAMKNYNDPRSSGGQSDNGKLEDQTTSIYRIYSNQLLRFNKVFGKHSVNALFAYEWNSYTGTVLDQIATGFAPGFAVGDATIVPYKAKGSQNEWAVQSLLFNANYAYDNRYLFQFSFRRDGASNFGENAKYGNFFSLSGGWNIHQEAFFDVDWVQQLKLRASYGSVGNRPKELYPQYALYSMGNGYNELPGAIISQVANPDLTWEKTYTAGVGVDAYLFDRLTVNLDYYNKKTTDLLYNVPLPGVTGVKGVFRNVGSVNNNGFEASVAVDILKGGDWKWNVAANIGINRNEVKELYGDKQQIIIANANSGILGPIDKILTPGKDVDTWYATEWAGVNAETGAPEWYTTNEEGERVRTSKYSDASKHQVVCGKTTPDFYGGFSTDLSWRNFDLSAIFSYSVGGEIYNYSRSVFDSDGAYTTYNQQKLLSDWSRWEKPGDNATHPRAEYQNKSLSNKPSSRYLEEASYLRLRNLTIGYSIPLKWKYISDLRVSASGENLFVISGFSGIDPELPAITNSGKAGVASSPYPQTRKFMFGLNVSF